MAAEWAEHFQSYGTSQPLLLNGLYAEALGTLIADPDPTPGRDDIVWRTTYFGSAGTFRKVLSASQTTVGVAHRIWFVALPTGGSPSNTDVPHIVQFNDINNVINVSIVVTTTGAIKVFRGDAGGTLLGTSAPCIVANAWQHIEAKVFISATVGTVEVRVDGVAKLTLTGLNTVNGTADCSQIFMGNRGGATFSGNGTADTYIKDIFMWNGTGTLNNNFAGTVSVVPIRPDADTTLLWTPSTGTTGWNILNAVPPVDTNYIAAGTSLPGTAVFTQTDLPANVTAVRAVMTTARATKTDGGDGNLQVGVRVAAANTLGANRPITSAFTYWYDWFELNPNTGVAWTPAGVNSSSITINRTS